MCHDTKKPPLKTIKLGCFQYKSIMLLENLTFPLRPDHRSIACDCLPLTKDITLTSFRVICYSP